MGARVSKSTRLDCEGDGRTCVSHVILTALPGKPKASVAAVRDHARKERGWHVVNGLDLCAHCARRARAS